MGRYEGPKPLDARRISTELEKAGVKNASLRYTADGKYALESDEATDTQLLNAVTAVSAQDQATSNRRKDVERLLTKPSWTPADNELALRIILERMVF